MEILHRKGTCIRINFERIQAISTFKEETNSDEWKYSRKYYDEGRDVIIKCLVYQRLIQRYEQYLMIRQNHTQSSHPTNLSDSMSSKLQKKRRRRSPKNLKPHSNKLVNKDEDCVFCLTF